ncbi:uncharacterized protein MYCFIDRAFT_174445 [Pseudocercospora fijiensis CIRAD86]|uniref:Uncharacterized protein n=1 Tax=Pseudocercospora fijiensis (strain CIRAD86) TaxID=383855 RepID=M3AEC9_PSEFD|nr:uncharacterized protein MYCFIDRAFT_174445 [Pseudocercospora fijiensis CIRAD86]EME82936.1 hypothetical protein MYCFIDRAFT_174445 [Pseudocercospora fijiensis CIRAD86]
MFEQEDTEAVIHEKDGIISIINLKSYDTHSTSVRTFSTSTILFDDAIKSVSETSVAGVRLATISSFRSPYLRQQNFEMVGMPSIAGAVSMTESPKYVAVYMSNLLYIREEAAISIPKPHFLTVSHTWRAGVLYFSNSTYTDAQLDHTQLVMARKRKRSALDTQNRKKRAKRAYETRI